MLPRMNREKQAERQSNLQHPGRNTTWPYKPNWSTVICVRSHQYIDSKTVFTAHDSAGLAFIGSHQLSIKLLAY